MVSKKATPNGKALRALSVRQPHAEAIMRGVKTVEFRSATTRIRGRIYIYAARGRYTASKEAELMSDYHIEDLDIDKLPRGVLIGTVELYGCDGGEWYLRDPERAKRLRKPRNRPQPVWFYPF